MQSTADDRNRIGIDLENPELLFTAMSKPRPSIQTGADNNLTQYRTLIPYNQHNKDFATSFFMTSST